MRNLYQKISQVLETTVKKEFSLTPPCPLWEIPKDEKFGDFSSMIALKLFHNQKDEVLKAAERFKKALEKELNLEIKKIEVVNPGFINVFFSLSALRDSLKKLLQEKENFFKVKRERKVLIEFVSANPTGPLSIAHGRQAVVGDVLANVCEFFGNKVEREYYINDEGNQIVLLLKSVERQIRKIKGEEVSSLPEGYQGDYIEEIAKKIVKQNPPDIKTFTLDYILNLIKKDLSSLEIKFTHWVSQRELMELGKVEEVIQFLRGKGKTYEKEGAIWFASTLWGDDKDRVLRKEDTQFTYFACDIAYHRNKLERGFDKLINLWGPDHHGYIPRLKAAIKALGNKEDVLDIIIIQIVKLKSKRKMSKRKGTAILLSDLIEKVGKDAARFYYLTRRNSSPLEFDLDLAIKSSFDNPLYYIQYAHARICSIFRKAGIEKIEFEEDGDWEKEEISLLRKLFQFSYWLDRVYYSLEPVFLIEFLKNVATFFHKFYENVPVLCQDRKIRLRRLSLCEGVRIVLACGLNLLGIKPLSKM